MRVPSTVGPLARRAFAAGLRFSTPHADAVLLLGPVYCPKCAKPLMQSPDGTWACSSGGLELSTSLGHKLAERYVNVAAAIPRDSAPMGIGLLYCPGCGVELNPERTCPECGLSIKDLLFELIEVHPHADGKGGWV